MVSKTRKQRAKKQVAIAGNGGIAPAPTPPSQKKSVHLKKTRPNMKSKMKVRLGLESPDIYEGFEDQKGVRWVCPNCHAACRVVGFCAACATGNAVGTTSVDSLVTKKVIGSALESSSVTLDAGAARKAKVASGATQGRVVHDTVKDQGKMKMGASAGGKKLKFKKAKL